MGKISAVIQKINNDVEYKTYFFRKAPDYQNLDLWLKPLYENNHLNNIDGLNSSYLEKVALENRENEKEDITALLVQIIDNAIINRNKEDFREDWYILKVIFSMPPKVIKIEYIHFIGKSLKEEHNSRMFSSDIGRLVVPVLLSNEMKEHLLELIKVLFDYKIDNTNKSYQERDSLVEKYWLFDLMKKHSIDIAKQIDIDGLKIIIDIIEEIIQKDEGAFNNIWIATIEEHHQNSFPDRYDNQLISLARDLLEAIEPNNMKSIIVDLLYKDHPIFKRLAFHTINFHYDNLKDIFWEWFDSDDNIVNSTFKHEFYKQLNDRSELFTDEELNKVLSWIENLDYSKYYTDRTDEQLEKITAYRKKEWLLTIKEYSVKANELYGEYDLIAPGEIEHPGFDSWSYGAHLIDKTFDETEELCDQSIEEIISYIKDFDPNKKEKGPLNTNEDLIEGLADALGICIKDNPNKFIEKLSLFDEFDYLHKYHIVYGFSNAWKEKIAFDWTNLLIFIEETLTNTFFESKDKYKFWLIGEIASLIKHGTQNDDNAFNKELLPHAKNILFKLIENKDNDPIQDNDWMHYVLNAPNGKVLHALMSYALRYGRLNSSQKVKWEEEIISFFTEQLEKNNSYSLYVFTILGDYLDNLIYLDKKWVYDNFNKIFSLDNDKLWEVAMHGYFSYSTAVYNDTYQKFKMNGHFKKMIGFSFKNDKTSEKIVQHICISFMSDFDEETIFDVIESKNVENILEIISFIWHGYRDKYKLEQAQKIYVLWNKIFDIFKDKSTDDTQEIFSSLSKWFVFIDTINETNLEWLKISAKYTEKRFNSYMIIEQLLRLVNDNVKNVGEIYLEMVENDIFPTYKEDEIRNIIAFLFKNDEKDNATIICNKYAQKGIFFLNDLMNEIKENK